MRKLIITQIVCISLAGCAVDKGGTPTLSTPFAPITTPGGSFSLLSLVEGTWTGTETASVGLSGPISVTFTQPPVADANIAGNITLTLSTGTFHGTFSGTVADMLLVATDGPAGVCNYTAHGILNEAGTQIAGTYVGSGPGACPTKAGTFVLSGQSHVFPPPPPPLDCVLAYYQMNNGNVNSKKNKCENTASPHGVWLGEFDVPGTPAGLEHDVCKFTPLPPGNPGNDMTVILSTAIACPVAQ